MGRQLLRLRAVHLEFEPPRNDNNPHTAFMSSLDVWLFERLGTHALVSSAAAASSPDAACLRRFGMELVVIVAASPSLPCTSTEWWALSVNSKQVFFHSQRFLCE